MFRTIVGNKLHLRSLIFTVFKLVFASIDVSRKVAVVNEALHPARCAAAADHVKYNLGGAKMYKCPYCGAVMDGECMNGAKNFFLPKL